LALGIVVLTGARNDVDPPWPVQSRERSRGQTNTSVPNNFRGLRGEATLDELHGLDKETTYAAVSSEEKRTPCGRGNKYNEGGER